MFKAVSTRQSFPEMEEKIADYWDKKNIFKRSIEERPEDNQFKFFDGPPFATGMPHYGHILQSVVKDIVPRYKTMQGYRVPRIWGWDCHGLPIENIVEEKLGLKSKEEIENYGIERFCEACRENVFIYTEEWQKTIRRLGRFVDMENSYKTMDFEYMNSVWWVFSKLWEKGLIYESFKSIHYCPHCDTPLSNFEVGQGYKDITDESVFVKFETANEPGTYFLAWTTTPWTLPGNVALAVGAKIEYVKVKYEDDILILAKDLLTSVFTEDQTYEVLTKLTGLEIIEKYHYYKPLFPYFYHPSPHDCAEIIDPDDNIDEIWKNYCTVHIANFVSVADGTGIVHIAPAFGEDDFNLAKANKIPLIRHVKPNGKFVAAVSDFPNTEVKPKKDPSLTDHRVNELLTAQGKVFRIQKFRHSYPHCWRCDTPLLNYTTPSWFVRVEKIRNQMVQTNQETNWVPEHIKDGRFGKWLEGARDWSISRNRFWGAPLPIWRCDCCGEIVCVESAEKLKELSGQDVTDLHKHTVDKISWPCSKCGSGESVKMTFVRHGKTQWNEEHRLQSASDIPLDDNGIEHAKILAKEINPDDYDAIICSPLIRAQQTAEIIAPGKEIIVDELLREPSVGKFEGLTVKEVFEQFPDVKTKHDLRWALQYGVETPQETKSRILSFIKKIEEKYPDKKVLVVTHGHFMHCVEWYEKEDESVFEKNFPNLYEMKRTIIPTFYRIPEILDCWFESGSMPYAQFGERENAKIPADFIAEAQDQTRGWFYTLHVLATALENKPAFKQCNCSGLVLAEDGKKMSKKLKNYPEPNLIFDKFGADAMRFYIVNSPVVKAEDLRFSEKGVEETVRTILLPFWNAYSFFVTYANTDNWSVTQKTESQNPLDLWILARLNHLVKDINEYMEAYKIFEATDLIAPFLDELTNWYIRRSRRRFWKSENDGDKLAAYSTLYEILITLSKILAPICPFISEEIFLNLTDKDSVHLENYPKTDKTKLNLNLEKEIEAVRKIVELGHAARANAKLKVRQPLSKVRIAVPEVYKNFIKPQKETILEELNVKNIEILTNAEEIAKPILKPNARVLGPRIGGKVQEIIKLANQDQFEIISDGRAKIGDEILEITEFELLFKGKEGENCEADHGFVVALDSTLTPELELEGKRNDLNRTIQDMRKEAGLEVSDRIVLSIQGADDILGEYTEWLKSETLAEEITTNDLDLSVLKKNVLGCKIEIKKI